MNLKNTLANSDSPWTQGSGPSSDVILASRIRLARNFKNHCFPCRQDREDALQVWKILSDYAQSKQGFEFIDLSQFSDLERQLLVEKHLISPQQAKVTDQYRALVLSEDGKISLLVNEEDHLRLQVFESGLNLEKLWQVASQLDDEIERFGEYAHSDKLGYLTSCPSNIGTGLRASVLVHLPALRLTKQLSIVQNISKMGLTVRGLYGEGSEGNGDFFQISNQQTLGHREEDSIKTLELVAQHIAATEREERKKLFRTCEGQWLNQVWRAYGILSYATSLTTEEAYRYLSLIRLGVTEGVIDQIKLNELDRLYMLIQPAYLMLKEDAHLSVLQRDQLRAKEVSVYLDKIRRGDRYEQ